MWYSCWFHIGFMNSSVLMWWSRPCLGGLCVSRRRCWIFRIEGSQLLFYQDGCGWQVPWVWKMDSTQNMELVDGGATPKETIFPDAQNTSNGFRDISMFHAMDKPSLTWCGLTIGAWPSFPTAMVRAILFTEHNANPNSYFTYHKRMYSLCSVRLWWK